ncbi:MAG: 4Fe-4S dicluster domain-containing protein [Clostridia bacterium]|nr:4Fe-4S dicluster domain-containing protein [Clostridia bacterium]
MSDYPSYAGRIEAAGVVGAGGAGFPTHVKAQGTAEIVIANGAECEPILGKDKALMRAYPGQIVAGLVAMMKSVNAEKGVIAIKRKNTREVEAMKAAVAKMDSISGISLAVRELDDFYPAGDEHVLVYELTGRIVPAGGIPLHVGAVVNNVETLLNVARAVDDGSPVTHKFVTLGGAVARPGTYRVPLGTSFARVIDAAGGYRPMPSRDGHSEAGLGTFGTVGAARAGGQIEPQRIYEALADGPMMGTIIPPERSLEAVVVTKTTSGVILVPRGHPILTERRQSIDHQVRLAQSACIQCTQCTDACPRFLLGHALRPHIIMRTLGYRRPSLPDDLDRYPDLLMAGLCTECGVCSLVCPMGLSPRRVNGQIKQAMAQVKVRWRGASGGEVVHPARKGRLIPSARLVARLGLSGCVRDAHGNAHGYGTGRGAADGAFGADEELIEL